MGAGSPFWMARGTRRGRVDAAVAIIRDAGATGVGFADGADGVEDGVGDEGGDGLVAGLGGFDVVDLFVEAHGAEAEAVGFGLEVVGDVVRGSARGRRWWRRGCR